jgi:hypothetical protein
VGDGVGSGGYRVSTVVDDATRAVGSALVEPVRR